MDKRISKFRKIRYVDMVTHIVSKFRKIRTKQISWSILLNFTVNLNMPSLNTINIHHPHLPWPSNKPINHDKFRTNLNIHDEFWMTRRDWKLNQTNLLPIKKAKAKPIYNETRTNPNIMINFKLTQKSWFISTKPRNENTSLSKVLGLKLIHPISENP